MRARRYEKSAAHARVQHAQPQHTPQRRSASQKQIALLSLSGSHRTPFSLLQVADSALTKDRATIGTRYVEVFRATPEQMQQALLRVAKSNNLAPMHMAQNMHGMQPYGYGPFAMPPHMMGPGMGQVMPGPGADAV